MPERQYIQSAVNRTARPRSKRLRELGGTIVSTSASVVAGGGYSGVGKDHSHANLADLNRITVTDGYIYLTDEVVDPNTQEVTIETEKVMAGYADRAGANSDGYTLNWFIPVTVDGVLTLKLNPIYAGLWGEGWITSGGIGSSGSGGGSTVSVTQIVSSGTAIATITVDGVETTIYAPSGEGASVSWGTVSGYVIPLTVDGTTKNLLLSGALTGYATQSWVTRRGYLVSSDLSSYATQTWVGQQGYATESWVQQQGYLTAHGYIGTTQVQSSSAKQALAGITQIGLISSSGSTPAGTLKPITISSGLAPKYGLRWTYQYLDQSSINPTLQTVNKTIAFTDDIPTPKKLYFGSTTSDNYYDTTAQKVLDASLINGVTLTTAQTISGAKTFDTGGIVMTGANILTATDSTNNIGASDARFLAGHIRNLYTTYFAFMSDDGQTQRGNIGMGDGYAEIIIAGSPNSTRYTFNATYGFFHGGNGTVPCGRDDHRWSNIYGVAADLAGDLTLDSASHIDLGPLRLQYDSTNKALRVTKKSGSDNTDYGLCADGFVTAGGIGGSSSQYVKYVSCTQSEYNALQTKDDSTIYAIGSPVSKVYIGGLLLFQEN